jgi:hypothetical protein
MLRCGPSALSAYYAKKHFIANCEDVDPAIGDDLLPIFRSTRRLNLF